MIRVVGFSQVEVGCPGIIKKLIYLVQVDRLEQEVMVGIEKEAEIERMVCQGRRHRRRKTNPR